MIFKSHFIHIVVKFGQLFFKSFSLSNTNYEIACFSIFVGKSFNCTPVVKHILWESFSLSISSKGSGETERLRNWQICFNLELNIYIPS